MSYEQSNAIVEKLDPHVVIPEHYLTVGASITLTTLGTAEEWVDQQEARSSLTRRPSSSTRTRSRT